MNLEQIVKELDKTVHGQKEAKTALANAAHIALLEFKIAVEKGDYQNHLYKNVLLTGPSGSGKTLLVRELSKITKINLYECDASQLSPAGYKGGDFEEFINDIERQEGGSLKSRLCIVFLDEFDKLTSAGGDKDGWKSSIQGQILKEIEDTPTVIWVLAGNYPQIRYTKTNAGFGKKHKEEVMAEKSLVEALDKVGVSSQVLGRCRFFAALQKHTKEDLEAILRSSNMLIKNYTTLAKSLGKRFKLSDKNISTIAEKCASSDTGARMLQQELNVLLMHKIANITHEPNTEVVEERKNKEKEEEKEEVRTTLSESQTSLINYLDQIQGTTSLSEDKYSKMKRRYSEYVRDLRKEYLAKKDLYKQDSIKWKNKYLETKSMGFFATMRAWFKRNDD